MGKMDEIEARLAAVIAISAAFLLLFCSCASVPVQSKENEIQAKRFNPPPAGWGGLCVYVGSDYFRATMQKTRTNKSVVNVFVDGQYAGDIRYGLFLLRNLRPGPHVLMTRAAGTVAQLPDIAVKFDVEERKTVFYQVDIDCTLIVIPVGIITTLTPTGKWKLAPFEFESAWKHIAPFHLAANRDARSKDLKTADYGEGKGSIPAVFQNQAEWR